jgi:hypothetical protein
MIPAEAVDAARALLTTQLGWRSVATDGESWSTDGHFAVIGRADGDPFDDRPDDKLRQLRAYAASPRVPLRERAGWRRPLIPGDPKCAACEGTGDHRCNCHHCEIALCEACDGTGEGEPGHPESLGQVVLDGEGLTLVVSARFAPVIDAAASLVALDVEPNQQVWHCRYTVGLLDADGRVVGLVMPMNETPRAPEAAP